MPHDCPEEAAVSGRIRVGCAPLSTESYRRRAAACAAAGHGLQNRHPIRPRRRSVDPDEGVPPIGAHVKKNAAAVVSGGDVGALARKTGGIAGRR